MLDQRPLYVTAALAFGASAAVTWAWCGSMSAMPDMPMAGGWTMSMAWMRMPGRGWAGSALEFVGMWSVMMIAMMLPVLVPMLARYRRAIHPHSDDVDALTLRVAGGYFAAWTAAGIVTYPAGVALAALAMRSPSAARAAPLVGAIALCAAGWAQISRWKSRRLDACRHDTDCCRRLAPTARAAWRRGVELGGRCLGCCAPLSAALLVLGVMNVGAMALVAAATSLERLAPRGEIVARAIGVALLVSGLVRAIGAVE